MKLWVPDKAATIIKTLQEHGYDAYVVGGCVRDSLLSSYPADWDITTSAKPETVKSLFPRTVDTGLAHGTVTVLMGKDAFEVTTYRIDGEYEDSRHPKEVVFTGELREDLRRRDFTINAMAYNETTGLVDAFGGASDLLEKTIRCVGNPYERFSEDALRILRAFRFAAQLGFSIEEKTLTAAAKLAPTLEKISAERISAELLKLICSSHPSLLRLAYEAGITKVILPEFDRMMETPQHTPHHCYSVGEHTLISLEHVPGDKVLRLTMLLHDMGKPKARTTDAEDRDHFKGHNGISEKMASKILRRLRFDNDTIGKVTKLVLWHDFRPNAEARAVRRAMNRIGTELFPLLLQVQYADSMAQSGYRRDEKLERIHQVKRVYLQIKEAGECVTVKNLEVNGRDLLALGMKPGKAVGDTLQKLLELVLDDPAKNKKEYLLSVVRQDFL